MRIILFLFIFILLLVNIINAQTYVAGGDFLSRASPTIQVINLVITMVALGIAIAALPFLEDDLRKRWVYLTSTIIILGLYELVKIFEKFNLLQLQGLDTLLEFLLIISFLIAIVTLQKFFRNIAVK